MPVYDDPVDPRALTADALPLVDRCPRGTRHAGHRGRRDQDRRLSDRRGIASHGTARLARYVSLIEAGVMDATARPVLVRARAAMGRFDARNGWGTIPRGSRSTGRSRALARWALFTAAPIEPLRHRRLVLAAGGPRRADRHEPDEQVAAGGTDTRAHVPLVPIPSRSPRPRAGTTTSAWTWPPRRCRAAARGRLTTGASRCTWAGRSTSTAAPPPRRTLR